MYPYLSLATSHCNVDESSDVCHSLLRTSLGLLLLLLRLDLKQSALAFVLEMAPVDQHRELMSRKGSPLVSET